MSVVFSVLAFTFASLACIIAIHSIFCHLRNYKKPSQQRIIVRILLMPVIYAICSSFSFQFTSAELVLDPIRDCYEAFVLWMFFNLLISYMGGEGSLLEKLDDGRLPTSHPFPFSMFLKPVDFAEPHNFLILKRAILQFVIVKPIQTILIGLLRVVDHYEDGIISSHSGFIYANLIYNFSVMTCMYGLVMFYLTTRQDLADKKPVPKFLCIKAVLFFSFWQSLALAILYRLGALEVEPSKAQDFLTCFEMMIASFIHRYAFSELEYVDLDSARLPWPVALRDAIGTKDLWIEIEHTWRGTHFRAYNDLLESGTVTPLLASSRSHLALRTNLEFDEVHPNDEIESEYLEAKEIGDDHKYTVISPPISTSVTPK